MKRELDIKKIHCTRCGGKRAFDKRAQSIVKGLFCTKCGGKQ